MSDDGEKGKKLYELKKQLKFLNKIRGSGTELVSIYITPGYPIPDVTNKLKDEYGQASNIKSKTTRKNVQEALDKLIHYLKMFRKTPPTGMALFCGNISKDQGKSDVQLFSIVPPEPLNTQFYRCDSTFVLEPLSDLLEVKETYGLVVMDGKEATLALLRGKNTKIVKKLHSTAHSKIKVGGQSARRYERIIEESIEKYYKRIGESMDKAFLGVPDMQGVIVGGPGPAKEDFLKLKPFNYQIKILGVLDTGYTEEYGVQELTKKSGSIIQEQETVKEKKLVERFIKDVVTGGLATYGEKEVREVIESYQAGTVLISEGLEWKKVKSKCSKCGEVEEKLMKKVEPYDHSCGGKMKPFEEKDVADELIELAEKNNIKVEMVSTETSEGSQFLNSFMGIGAFLRYK